MGSNTTQKKRGVKCGAFLLTLIFSSYIMMIGGHLAEGVQSQLRNLVDDRAACYRALCAFNGVSTATRGEMPMSAAKAGALKVPEIENSLVAKIRTSSFSYFIASHHPTRDTERIDDEAAIEVDAEISEMEPLQPQHLGQQITCSILCARSFQRGIPPEKLNGMPLLYTVTLRKNARSLLTYLPADAFWAIVARLETGTLKHIEARYRKPLRGIWRPNKSPLQLAQPGEVDRPQLDRASRSDSLFWPPPEQRDR